MIFSLYGSFSSYPIPGPALNGAGNDGGNGQQPARPTTTLRTSTTATPTQTSAPGGGNGGCTVPKWQQCGGQSYSGCTTCASGSTCQRQNDFYSQCM